MLSVSSCLPSRRSRLDRWRWRASVWTLIEIGASTVVIWELSGTGQARQRRALRLIGVGFMLLAAHLLVQSTWALVSNHHPHHSPLGIAWTAITALVMFSALAAGKARTGAALNNPVLRTEGRVTLIDGLLSGRCLRRFAYLTPQPAGGGLPVAGYVLVYYAIREAGGIFSTDR